jgi:hypothetical protein
VGSTSNVAGPAPPEIEAGMRHTQTARTFVRAWQRHSTHPTSGRPASAPNAAHTNSVALIPQANYTDWATATCRRNLVPTFADRGVSRGQRGGSPTAVNLSFLDRNRYLSLKYLLIYPHEGWVDPILDPLLLRISGSAGNQTRDLWVLSRNSDH